MRVLIFGLGLNQGGVGSARFFAKQDVNVKVTDLKNAKILEPSLKQLKEFKNISYTLGSHNCKDIDWADLIIKNPAIKPGNPYLEYAKKQGKQVETDMGIFLQYVRPDQIIGITGTKGKSTAASLIYEVLSKSLGVNVTHPKGVQPTRRWEKVILAGNIGRSVLELIPIVQKSIFPPQGWKAKSKEILIVLELSSFQLEAFEEHQVSPKWAVITNITPDHLNYYQTMADYIKSKKIIGKYQKSSDFLFLRKNDSLTAQPDFLKGLKAKIIYFSQNDLPKNFHPKLLGSHNLENLAVALAVAKNFGINEKTTLNILSKFKGVPFRMELVKEWHGVKIYNDTAATSPEAGIQAVNSLGVKLRHPPGDLILICGGMNKNLDYREFAKAISRYSKAVYFIEGDIVGDLVSNITDQTIIQGRFTNFEDLLQAVKKDVQTNPYFKKVDTILFSPGGTSFNLFQNEFDRGRKFNAAVQKIFGDV